jgi:hypothetical protein
MFYIPTAQELTRLVKGATQEEARAGLHRKSVSNQSVLLCNYDNSVL